MDLSGLIFVALALVWGLVLIPKALRAHDDAARTRSVDASSGTARVLTRPGRAPAATSAPTSAPAPASITDGAPRQADLAGLVARQRRRAAAAARRRRRVLGLLVLATLVVGGVSAAGVLAPWAAGIPGGVVLGFLVLARMLVRREHAAWETTLRRLRAGEPAAQAEHAEQEGSEASPVVARPEAELHVVARNDQGVAVVSESEDTASFDAASLAQAVGAPAGTLWDPLPVTLPTYVTKPRASRSVRTIDLLGAGVSSSGHDAADSALVADGGTASGEQEPPAQQAVGS